MNRPDDRFLQTADAIGARLCRDAIWAGNRCNWVGAGTVASNGGLGIPVQRACGVDLFCGTSGIALFLTYLYAATGERAFCVTAEGAIRQALSRLDDLAPSARIRFDTGLTGIAYALIELAELLSVSKFAAMALLISEELGVDRAPDRTLASHAAGAIPALLHIHRKHPTGSLLQLAVDCGERLVRTPCERTPEMALAFLELWAASGEHIFRDAARQAVESCRGTAPFTRLTRLREGGAQCVPWLTGASGSTLVALRAYELLGDKHCLAEATLALTTLAEHLRSSCSGPPPKNFSLNRGQSADAELLLRASQTLEHESYVAAARRVGHRGVELFGGEEPQWPCDAPGGAETPGLMTGLAGIGYFYLRLHDRTRTPSLLLVAAPRDAA